MQRTRSRFAVVGVVFALAIVGACTTFNGIADINESNSGDASFDASNDATDEKVTVDAGAGFLDLADAVKFCVKAFDCPNLATSTIESIDVPVDTQHFSSCVDWVNGGLPPDRVGVAKTASFLECAAQAASCTAAVDCMWFGLIDPTDPRCDGIDAGKLTDAGIDKGVCIDDGGTVIYCLNDAIEHCGSSYYPAGSVCKAGNDGIHYCDLTIPCGTTTDCNGSVLTFCGVNGDRAGHDCAIGGFTCGSDISGDTDCLTNGTVRNCTTVGATCSSDGDTVYVCDSQYSAAYDCVAAGGTCDDTFTARCKRPTDTCAPGGPGIDTCNGNVISLCSGGQPVSFDCSSIGLKCLAASNGQTGHCG
jgi:hypothetical protein